MSITLTKENTVFSKLFRKDVSKFDVSIQREILNKLEGIMEGTTKADIKKLTNDPHARFRLRIGKYRLLFHVDAHGINHFSVCRHRNNFYKA